MARKFKADSMDIVSRIGSISTAYSQEETFGTFSSPRVPKIKDPYLSKHVCSPVPLEKQQPRPQPRTASAHQNRFVLINDQPEIFSKVRKVVSPDFQKSLGRVDKKKPSESRDLTYYPRYNTVWRNSNYSRNFNGFCARKPLIKPKGFDLSYSVKYSAVEPSEKASLFSKSPPKPINKQLPCFMEKHHQRFSLNEYTNKSFEMSNHQHHDYLELKSGFGKGLNSDPIGPSSLKSPPPKIISILSKKLAASTDQDNQN